MGKHSKPLRYAGRHRKPSDTGRKVMLHAGTVAGGTALTMSVGAGVASAHGESDVASLDAEQTAVVDSIIAIGKERGEPQQAWQVAIQAGMTESKLRNLNYGDRDSLGVFQMRPSMGWGTPEQVTDIEYQVNKFYDILDDVPGWQSMAPGAAAQAVERSAYPERYHRWEDMAENLTNSAVGVGGSTVPDEVLDESTDAVEQVAEVDNTTYTVVGGDTLTGIAAVHGVDWHDLYAANKDEIEDPDLIYPGQEFEVP
jgi:nucleoid-associated protein YgaU